MIRAGSIPTAPRNTNQQKLKFDPPIFRLFIITSFLSCGIIQAVMSIAFSTHYIIFRDESDFLFKSLRMCQSISSQHLRGSLFITVVERIVSTMYLDRYNTNSNNLRLFWILTLISCIFTASYSILSTICKWLFQLKLITLPYVGVA